MSKDIVLVPLDSRPVNSDMPKLICMAAGVECEIPDQDMLGKYMNPGNCDKIADWFLKSPQKTMCYLWICFCTAVL